MKLKCAIIDDEPLALSLMESYVLKTPFLELEGKYNSAAMALENIREGNIELLFLDIQMPELNGLELSRLVPDHVRIIFTTAFDQYAVDGFRVNALDYLLKPISYNEFLSAANKALEWFTLKKQTTTENRDEEFIYVKSDYKLVQIHLKDILYIEGLKDYLKIYLANEPRPVISLLSMKSMEERLMSPRFMRVHRSYIVQMDKVKILDKGQIIFGKTRIPISSTYKTEIMAYLEKHLL